MPSKADLTMPQIPNKPNESTIRVPFETPRLAEIAYKVLSVDQEPRRNFVQKTLSLDGDCLEVRFQADQVKNLRTAITSFFESLLLCQDTIKQFDGFETATQEAANSIATQEATIEDAGAQSGSDSA